MKRTPEELKKLEREVCALCDRTGARVVTLLLDSNAVTAFRAGLTPDQIAHELITEANRLRRELRKAGS